MAKEEGFQSLYTYLRLGTILISTGGGGGLGIPPYLIGLILNKKFLTVLSENKCGILSK